MKNSDKVFITSKTLNAIFWAGEIRKARTAIWIAIGSFLIPTTMLTFYFFGIIETKHPLMSYCGLGLISVFFFIRIFMFWHRLRQMLKRKNDKLS